MCGFWVALHDHWGIPKYRCSIMFSLHIITIFYHLRTIRVNQRNHIALQIVDFYHSAYKRLHMPFRGIKWSSLVFGQKKKRPSISRKSLSWSRWQDLNLRPFGPEPNALPNCATPRKASQQRDSNPRPAVYETAALPTEPCWHGWNDSALLVYQMTGSLSRGFRKKFWWI